MQFLVVTVGDRSLGYLTELALEAPFTFPQPVKRIRCALQALELSYPREDEHVRLTRLEPHIEFDDQVSSTSGRLRVNFAFRDDGGGLFDAKTATFYTRFVLFGE